MLRRLMAILPVLGAIACELEPLDGAFVVLHVTGSVLSVDGDPVAGAALDIRARGPESCGGGFAEGRAVSDAAGNFGRELGTFNYPQAVCVWIAVVPPAGSPFAPDTLTIRPARLEVAPDTINVTIVLTSPPRA